VTNFLAAARATPGFGLEESGHRAIQTERHLAFPPARSFATSLSLQYDMETDLQRWEKDWCADLHVWQTKVA